MMVGQLQAPSPLRTSSAFVLRPEVQVHYWCTHSPSPQAICMVAPAQEDVLVVIVEAHADAWTSLEEARLRLNDALTNNQYIAQVRLLVHADTTQQRTAV